MFHISNLFAPIRLPSDASSQPDPAPLNLTIESFQAARDSLPDQRFSLRYGQQPTPTQAKYDPRHFDGYLKSALVVCGCPSFEPQVEATFRVLTGQPKPVGFEAGVRALADQTQATLSLPFAIKAIIDVDALITFVQQEPGQAMSSPDVLRMLIYTLHKQREVSEEADAICDAVKQRDSLRTPGNGGAELLPFTVEFNYKPSVKQTGPDSEEMLSNRIMANIYSMAEDRTRVDGESTDQIWEDIHEVLANEARATVDELLKSPALQPDGTGIPSTNTNRTPGN